MQTKVFTVPGISCEHCRRAITESVRRLSGIASVEVDLDAKKVAVTFDPSSTEADRIRAAIEDAGYDVVS
ncbi:MAG TPA: copper ion binding protein [Limnochordales bacterium]